MPRPKKCSICRTSKTPGSCHPYSASSGGGAVSHTPAAVCDRSRITNDACRFGAVHLSPLAFHPLPSSVAAFQGSNGAGDDDAADTGDLAQTEMLGQDGVAEDG
jgi:hypothetical protein